MSNVLQNLSDFAAAGFSFPDHTVYIWTAYAVSFLVLMGLVVWTQIQTRQQSKLAKTLEAERKNNA
ncbi:MAG: heme exporter protein CcmD [Alphaproteobacteria bacterium]